MTFFIIYEVKNSAFYEDKTDTNCADVVSLGGAPKLSPQRRIRRDARRGEQFGEGEREPDAAFAEQPAPVISPRPVASIIMGTQILMAPMPSAPTACPTKMPSMAHMAEMLSIPNNVGRK